MRRLVCVCPISPTGYYAITEDCPAHHPDNEGGEQTGELYVLPDRSHWAGCRRVKDECFYEGLPGDDCTCHNGEEGA